MFFHKSWLFNSTFRTFDCIINLPFFVLKIVEPKFSVFFFTLYTISLHILYSISFLLLCFCFKNLDLAFIQRTQFGFSLSTLFVTFTSCSLKLCVKSFHPKQCAVPISFPVFIGFIFYCVFHPWQCGQYLFNKISDVF